MAKRAKHHVKSRAVLPKRAPKRTGKSGIGPREYPGDLVQQDKARQEKEPEAELLVTPATPRKPRQSEKVRVRIRKEDSEKAQAASTD